MAKKLHSLSFQQKIVRVLIFFLTIGVLFAVWNEREKLENLTHFGLLGIFLINLISSASVVFPLPGAASVFIGGSVWNPLSVGLASGIGASLGEVMGYLVGFGGRGLVFPSQIKNKWWVTFKKIFHKHGFVTILVMAAIPLPIFDFVGILAGSLEYPLWKFYLATLIGRSIRNYIFAVAGARILP